MKTDSFLGVLLSLAVLSLSSFTVYGNSCNSTCGFGVCNNETGICNCSTNWYGDNCTEFICDKANPCLVEGVCERVGVTDFKCNCPEGYGGTLCQANEGKQPITLCSPNPSLVCGDNGVCVIDPVSQNETCVCSPGFSGQTCGVETNPCLSRGCGVGECYLTNGWFACECPEGLDPKLSCKPLVNTCFYEPCVNGTCTVPVPHDGKDYICSCHEGFTGKNCSTPISFCNDNPCLNGGTCNDLSDFSGYTCTCPPYYEGENCSVPYDPCSCTTCSNNGSCSSESSTVSEGIYTYSTSCNCTNGFTGTDCETDIDECLDSPCANSGICTNTFGGFICQCPAGITGHMCEQDINECDDDPCLNGGVCQNEMSSFTCDCTSTQFTGPICDIPLNQTCHSHPCQFNGMCEFSDLLRKPVCTCPSGFIGDYCSYVYQPCLIGSCDPEGTLKCIPDNSSSTVSCHCREGYSGPTCSMNIQDSCVYNQCLNNGSCTDINGTFFCSCLPGFSGRTCENVIKTECQSELTCINGECVRILDDEFCKCNDGWGGQNCAVDINECSQTPCKNGGSCKNLDGGYQCNCPSNYKGINCEIFESDCDSNPCENGGTCVFNGNRTTCLCSTGYKGVRCENQECPERCTSLANDSKCDIECFIAACNYDGHDPCFTEGGVETNPWADCPVCKDKYNNGYCDQECNNAICLYDGADCISTLECPTETVEECASLVNNNVCDESCNTYECPFDTVDCRRQLYLSNFLILYVRAPESDPFEGEKEDHFLLSLGILINAQVELVEKNEVSEDDIEDKLQYVNTVSSNDDGSKYRYWKLVMRVNIAFCTASCPTTIEQVLRQIYAAYNNGQTSIDNYGIVDAIKGSEVTNPTEGPSNMGQIIGGVIASLAIVVLVIVVIFVLGKRVRSDGGVRESVKKLVRVRGTFRIPGGSTPEPSEANLMTRGQSCGSDRNSGSIDAFDDPSPSSTRRGNHPLPHFTWNHLEAPLKTTNDGSAAPSPKEGATCVMGQRGKDQRKWTYLHCEAARMSNDSRDLMSGSLRDINSQGPGGLTPLMVAIMSEDKYYRTRGRPGGSVRSDSSSGSEYSEYDPMIVSQSPKFPRMFSTIPHSKPYDSKIPTLIHAPAHNINLANDQGETALHLAVKHNRDEYIHYLLLIKADPNAQDRWGKTPLHMAIGAVNDRAAQIIIECPRINLELKSHGGITPMMLAVKMGNNRVLQQLLAKNAEITATDAEGRTAVHWSAMINNVEALRLLIKQGPDNVKDAPNLKGETALFLACREGCLGAVRHLLDCYANATLVDSLERSPLQIAYEKQNLDVIEMLQQSNQGPLGGPSPSLYPMKPLHSANNMNPMFGRNGGIKIEPPQVPPVVQSQAPPTSSSRVSYQFQNAPGDGGMIRYSSIEAELEHLVASTQYPIMMNYSMYTPQAPPTLPVATQAHIMNTSPRTVDSGHSPGHMSIISPLGVGSVGGSSSRSPGDSGNSTDPNFSPVGSEIYPGTSHTSPQAGVTPYSCTSNPTIPSTTTSSQQPALSGLTPLQHLPTGFMNGSASVHPTTSEMQATTMESAAFSSTIQTNSSPLIGQTVSPNPTPLTIAQATVNGAYNNTSLQTSIATGNSSPSSHYGFPSPPKEAGGDYGAYGTPYSGDTVNSVNSMTPSPEDGSSHQVDGSPQQYTTIHGQYSYSSDAYQISLQPCNTAAIRGSHFSELSSFNPKESTV